MPVCTGMSWVSVYTEMPIWREGKKILVFDDGDGPMVVIGVYREELDGRDADEDDEPTDASKRWEDNCSGTESHFTYWMEIPSLPD